MTKTLLIKLLRDMRATSGRLVLMIIAISLSLITFSTMLYARSLTTTNMAIGYESTNPASARITVEPGIRLDQVEAFVEAAKAEPGVIDATARMVGSVKIQQSDGNDSKSLQLFIAAPDDPMQIARFDVTEGTWPAPKGEVLIERTALEPLGLKTGDQITVVGPNGKPVELTVSGVVHDQGLSPAIEGGTGYITTDTLPLLGMPSLLNQVAFTVADQPGQTEPSRNRDAIVATALKVADRLEQIPGVHAEQVAVPPPYEHPHNDIANTLLTALLAFGALALLLSAILIATMFHGLLTAQVPQIGMMKAIGARSSQILQFYLTMIFAVAATATILALLPGTLLGQGLAGMLLGDALNIDITNLAIPFSVYAAVVAAGIGVPLFIALVPLVRAARLTVREALDERGVSSNQGGLVGKMLGRLKGINRTLLMAFRNIFRRRARLLLSVGLLATAGAIFISGLNTMAGFQAIPNTIKDVQSWDVQIRVAELTDAATIKQAATNVEGVTSAEVWSSVPAGIQYAGQTNVTRTYPDQGHGALNINAIPEGSTVFTPPKIVSGRWLNANETEAVVLSQNALKSVPNAKVGDTVELVVDEEITSWKVVGIASELAGVTCPCVTQAGFENAVGGSGQGNLVRIVTAQHDEPSRLAIGQAVSDALVAKNIKAQGPQAFDSLVRSTEGHSDLLVVLILMIASAIGIVGLMGLGSMMGTSVIERTREFGIMSAIGAQPTIIRRLVIFEGVFIALVSFLVAIVPAVLLTWAMGVGLGYMFFGAPVPFEISLQAVLVWVVIVLLGAALATLAPAYRASRLTIREALAYL